MKKVLLIISLCLGISKAYCNRVWETTEFFWNAGVIALCDKGPDPDPVRFYLNENSLDFNATAYQNIQAGDIVWIKCRFLKAFCQQVFPAVQHPFVLVINDGDESFPSNSGLAPESVEQLLLDPRILHIFAQNCDYPGKHPKITQIPIGIDYHTIAYKGSNGGWGEIGSPREQEMLLTRFLHTFRPTYLRKKKAFVDFQHSDSMGKGGFKRYLQFGEDRTQIFGRLARTGLIDYSNWMRRSELWKKKGEYAFSISPHGNGLDCHRTWEDLILGCIVIVKTSPLDPLYEGLPVVIVKDWSEITQENLDRWLNQYQDAFTNPSYREKLTHNYWMNKIRMATKTTLSPIDQLIRELERSCDKQKAIALAKELIEAACPQQKRVAELEKRVEKAQKEMRAKVAERNLTTAPFLSFAMPCYNRASVLPEVIASIYDQNFSFPFEIIVVDDASTDGSYELLLQYEKRYPNFFVFKNDQNKKSPATRNIATCYARAPYICNADSDDVFEPNTVEPLLRGMIDHGNEVAYFHELRYFYQIQDPKRDVDRTPRQPNDEICLEPYLREMHISPCAGNKIYTKRSWLKSGGYLEVPGHDTWTFSYKLLANGYNGYLPLGIGYRHRLWANQSNVWHQDLKNGVHDISPKTAVMENPELFHPTSFDRIANYKPSGAEFMIFLQKGIKDGSIRLSDCFSEILSAYLNENNQNYEAALDFYLNALKKHNAHPNLYLRAAYVAILLDRKDTALSLLRAHH